MQLAYTVTDKLSVFKTLLLHGDVFCDIEQYPEQQEHLFFGHVFPQLLPKTRTRIKDKFQLESLVLDWSRGRAENAREGDGHPGPAGNDLDKLIDDWIALTNRRFCCLNRCRIAPVLKNSLQVQLEEFMTDHVHSLVTEIDSLVQGIRQCSIPREDFRNKAPSYVMKRCAEMARGKFNYVTRPAIIQRLDVFSQMLES